MSELFPRNNFLLFLSLLVLTSCTTTHLFEGVSPPPDDFSKYVLAASGEPVLKPGDKITISIWGHDNLSIGSLNQPYVSNEETGRWVLLDKGGEVNLPKVGRVKLGGFNVKEAAHHLERLYIQHIVEPVINVRILNHFITILGEVKNPGKYQIQNEPIKLVELIGQAGGFTDYADPELVKLMRSIEGKPYNFSVDFTSFREYYSKNAYLQSEDVVYVPPKNKKQSDDSLTKAVGVASIVTSIALIISFFVR